MRREFIECKSRSTAARRCPWTEMICKADGGYWCFEDVADGWRWKGQK